MQQRIYTLSIWLPFSSKQKIQLIFFSKNCSSNLSIFPQMYQNLTLLQILPQMFSAVHVKVDKAKNFSTLILFSVCSLFAQAQSRSIDRAQKHQGRTICHPNLPNEQPALESLTSKQVLLGVCRGLNAPQDVLSTKA